MQVPQYLTKLLDVETPEQIEARKNNIRVCIHTILAGSSSAALNIMSARSYVKIMALVS